MADTELETAKTGFYGGRSLMALLSCLFVFLTISENGAVTPALNAMKEGLWSDLPASTIALVNTLPALTSILGCMVTGWVAGKYLSWRTFSILAFVFLIAFGVAPAVLNVTDFYETLVWRALHGLACGLMWPLGNALVLAMYEGKAQGNVLGWGQSMQSFGGVVMQLLGGFLATIQPQYCYYAFLLAGIGLIFAFGIPSLPKTIDRTKAQDKSKGKQKEKVKLPGLCWYALFLFFALMVLLLPILIGNSTLMAQRNLGDSAWSGIATSCYSAGGVIIGVIWGAAFRKLKWNMLPLSFFMAAIGFVMCIFADSAFMVCLSLVVTGLGCISVRPTLYEFLNHLVSPEQVAAMLGYATAVFNLGTFVGTYYIKFCNFAFFGGVEAPENPMYVSAVLFVVLGVVSIILNAKFSHQLRDVED